MKLIILISILAFKERVLEVETIHSSASFAPLFTESWSPELP